MDPCNTRNLGNNCGYYSRIRKMDSGPLWMENIGEIVLSDNDGEYFWILPEILLGLEQYYCILSPCFKFDHENWNLAFIPGFACGGILSPQCHNLYLWMKDYNSTKENYTVELRCENKSGEYVSFAQGETENGGFHPTYFLKKENIHLISCNGRAKIICRMKKKEQTYIITEMSSQNQDEEGKNEASNAEDTDKRQSKELNLKGVDRLIENYQGILNDEWGSDVILKSNDHEFRAHRIILRARSPVFASMFNHDMIEKKKGEVDVSDCSTAAFCIFLQFLYSGKTDGISSENVVDLYYIADKYQVDDLKSDCIEFMKNSLSVVNFCDIMALSLRHSESELQKFATKFFCRNMKNIVKTVQWQTYITDYPIQANELYIIAINI